MTLSPSSNSDLSTQRIIRTWWPLAASWLLMALEAPALSAIVARLVDPEITLAFVGNQAIRTLNRKFRRKDKPTDVLSFPIRDFSTDGKFYLGDIVIAVPVALEQARRQGHSLEREIELLVIHGFLHLLGFDHGAGIEDEEENLHRIVLEKRK